MATKENGGSDVLEVFTEAFDFLLDLIGKLFDVSNDQGRARFWIGFVKSLKDC